MVAFLVNKTHDLDTSEQVFTSVDVAVRRVKYMSNSRVVTQQVLRHCKHHYVKSHHQLSLLMSLLRPLMLVRIKLLVATIAALAKIS